MKNRTLQIEQLDSKVKNFADLAKLPDFPDGWIKTLRGALGMSLQQLGNKLNITKQSAQDIEKREKEGTITLKALRDAAEAMDMQMVYGFVPKDGSLEALIERKSIELATKIVLRTSNTMKLEGQGNSPERLKKAIEERATQLRNEMHKMLWA